MNKGPDPVESQDLNAKLPTPEDFLMKVPLYERFRIDASCVQKLYDLQFFESNIDWYCIGCRRPSIFEGKNKERYSVIQFGPAAQLPDRLFGVSIICQRDRTHNMYFLFKVVDQEIIKIGQYPSLADIYSAEIGRYRKILGDEKYREFSRALGLSSHGVGIGAFVYLRRIFESLIDEAYQKAKTTPDWNEDIYAKSRMDEKILLLRDYLPEFLVENRGLYSILSKGIHSLAEQECLMYFDTIKVGIELILDEKIQQQEKRDKTERAKRAIESIKNKLT